MRKTFSLAAATCLLALPLVACDDQPDATPSPSPVPTTMPTVAPGRLGVAVGTGTAYGWDGNAPAQNADLWYPGPLATLPNGDVLLTMDTQPQLIKLGANGALQKVSNQANGMSLFGDSMQSLAVRGDTISVIVNHDSGATLSTLAASGGESHLVGRIPARMPTSTGPELIGTSLAPVRDGWLVQVDRRVFHFGKGGKRTQIRMPIVPLVLAADGDDLLAATADSVVRLRDMKIVDRMALKLRPGSVPIAITPDGQGGAFVATGGWASIVRTSPAKPSTILAAADGPDHAQCGVNPSGDPEGAPFRRIGGLTVRGKTLLISSAGCHRVYQLGLER